jgi:hypothetical protein
MPGQEGTMDGRDPTADGMESATYQVSVINKTLYCAGEILQTSTECRAVRVNEITQSSTKILPPPSSYHPNDIQQMQIRWEITLILTKY